MRCGGLATADQCHKSYSGAESNFHPARRDGDEEQTARSRLFAGTAGRTGIIDRPLDVFAGFTGPLLNAADQFALLALDKLQIVICELRPFLFQLASDDIPIPFDL
jgi:hypothetical protein